MHIHCEREHIKIEHNKHAGTFNKIITLINYVISFSSWRGVEYIVWYGKRVEDKRVRRYFLLDGCYRNFYTFDIEWLRL